MYIQVRKEINNVRVLKDSTCRRSQNVDGIFRTGQISAGDRHMVYLKIHGLNHVNTSLTPIINTNTVSLKHLVSISVKFHL